MHKTKKSELEKIKNNRNRGFSGFNTGIRNMKSKKDYERVTPLDIRNRYGEEMER